MASNIMHTRRGETIGAFRIVMPIIRGVRNTYQRYVLRDLGDFNVRYLSPKEFDEEGSTLTCVANLAHLVFMASVVAVSFIAMTASAYLVAKIVTVGLVLNCSVSFLERLPVVWRGLFGKETELSQKIKELNHKPEDELERMYEEFVGNTFYHNFDMEVVRKKLKEVTGARSEIHGIVGALSIAAIKKEEFEKAEKSLEAPFAQIMSFESPVNEENHMAEAFKHLNYKIDDLLTKKIEYAKSLIPLVVPEIKEEQVNQCYTKSDIYPINQEVDLRSDTHSALYHKSNIVFGTQAMFTDASLFLTPSELSTKRPYEICEKLISWTRVDRVALPSEPARE